MDRAARRSFVIQRHDARRLHYDLRLERDGALASWAVPKGLPLEAGERHLAVHVEDHPLDYGSFEGVIPAGEYGAGTVEIWDRGTYELLEEKRNGGLTVHLHGERVDGVWTLVPARLDGDERNWLLLRKDAAEAARGPGAPPAARDADRAPADRRRLALRAEMGRLPRHRRAPRRGRDADEPERQGPHRALPRRRPRGRARGAHAVGRARRRGLRARRVGHRPLRVAAVGLRPARPDGLRPARAGRRARVPAPARGATTAPRGRPRPGVRRRAPVARIRGRAGAARGRVCTGPRGRRREARRRAVPPRPADARVAEAQAQAGGRLPDRRVHAGDGASGEARRARPRPAGGGRAPLGRQCRVGHRRRRRRVAAGRAAAAVAPHVAARRDAAHAPCARRGRDLGRAGACRRGDLRRADAGGPASRARLSRGPRRCPRGAAPDRRGDPQGEADAAPLEPRQAVLAGRGHHEGRAPRLLPGRREGPRPAPAQAAVHDEALPRRLAGQELLPEAGAVAHPRLDRDRGLPCVDARRREEGHRLRARRRRARPSLDGQHGVHRHAHMGLARRSTRAAGLGDVRPRPVGGSDVRGRGRGGAARAGDARRARARVGAEDERLARDPRPRPDRPSSRVRRGARVRGHRRGRARPRAPGSRHDRVDEGEAPRRARRRKPERPGEDHRVRLLGAPEGGSARSRRHSAGTRSCPGSTSTPSRWTSCSSASAATAISSRLSSRAASRSAPPSARFAEAHRPVAPNSGRHGSAPTISTAKGQAHSAASRTRSWCATGSPRGRSRCVPISR